MPHYKTLPFLVKFAFPHRAEYERLFGVNYCDCPDVSQDVRDQLVNAIVSYVQEVKQTDERVSIMSFGSGQFGIEFLINSQLKALGYSQVEFHCVDTIYQSREQLILLFKNNYSGNLNLRELDQKFEAAVDVAAQMPLSFLPSSRLESNAFFESLNFKCIADSDRTDIALKGLAMSLKAYGQQKSLEKMGMSLRLYSNLSAFSKEVSCSKVSPDVLFSCDMFSEPTSPNLEKFLRTFDTVLMANPTQSLLLLVAEQYLTAVEVFDGNFRSMSEPNGYLTCIRRNFPYAGWVEG